MKKIFLLIIISLIVEKNVKACDVCGCSLNAGFGSAIPMFSKNMISLNTQFSQFNFKSNLVNSEIYGIKNDQLFKSTLSLRHYFKKRVFLNTEIPVLYNRRNTSTNTDIKSGIGDLKIGFQYILIDKNDSSKKIKQILVTGLKSTIPSAKYQQRSADKAMLPTSLQLGAGAWTYAVNLQYSISGTKWGATAIAKYVYNFENELFYKMGNYHTGQISVFYKKQFIAFMWMPNISLSYLDKKADLSNSRIHENTSYNALLGSASLDVFGGKWWLTIQYSRPILEKKTILQPSNIGNFRINIHYFLEEKQ